MFQNSMNNTFKFIFIPVLCLLLSACKEQTASGRASSEARADYLAQIDDTTWVVSGIQIRTPVNNDVQGRTTLSEAAVSKDSPFLLRFDRQLGVAYGYDGCQSFQMPLGRYRSGESLSFDLSSLNLNTCAQGERPGAQRQLILDTLQQVTSIGAELFSPNAREGHLRLQVAYRNSSSLILEPANLLALDLGEEFGSPLVDGAVVQPTLLLADDNSHRSSPNVRVFRSEAEFYGLWGFGMEQGRYSQVVDAIDFSTHTLLAATLGLRDTDGYRLEISSTEIIDGELRVGMTMTRPHPSCQVGTVATAPATLYALPTRSRLIRMSTIAKTGEPCEPTSLNAVQNLSINVLDDTSIRLTWDTPVGVTGAYRVSAHSGQSATSTTGEATLQALAPGVYHKVTVEPISTANAGDESVSAYVVTRGPARGDVFVHDFFNLPLIFTFSLPSDGSHIVGSFSVSCLEQQAMDLELSPTECALSRFAASEPFSQWLTNSTLEADNSVGYHLDHKGRFFIATHEALDGDPSAFPTGILNSVQCLDPTVQDGQFICAN